MDFWNHEWFLDLLVFFYLSICLPIAYCNYQGFLLLTVKILIGQFYYLFALIIASFDSFFINEANDMLLLHKKLGFKLKKVQILVLKRAPGQAPGLTFDICHSLLWAPPLTFRIFLFIYWPSKNFGSLNWKTCCEITFVFKSETGSFWISEEKLSR